VDDALLASSHAVQFSATWKPAESGDHFITARTTTASGEVAWSAVTDVSVQEPVTPSDLVPGSTVNVRDFGAAPNDDIDDTLAIQAAIDAIGPLGGTVYLPAGTYLIAPQIAGGDALTIRNGDLAIVGAGRDKTILSFRTFGGGDPATNWETINGVVHRGRAIVIEGSTDPLAPRSNISISSLRITGNAPATGSLEKPANPATGDGIDPSHIAIALVSTFQLSGLLLEDLELDNFRGGMIEANGAGFGLIEIVDNKIHGSNGIGVSISADVRMIGNDIYDHARASVVATHHNETRDRPQHGYYLGNTFEPRRTLTQNGLDGFVLRGQGFASEGLRDEPLVLVIQGNTLQGSLHHGLLLDAQVRGAIIAGNTFIDNGADGDLRHGHVTLAPGRSTATPAAIEDVVVRANSFAALGSADFGHAIFLDTTKGSIGAIDLVSNTLLNAESSGGAIERFLLLEAREMSNSAGVLFAENIADEIALAVEDISTQPVVAMRPLYRNNAVNVTGFTVGQNEFANTGATAAIRPSWSEARITTDRANVSVTLAAHAGSYPDQTVLHLEAVAGGHGFNLQPDAAWLRLTDPVFTAPAESIHLVKRAGRFEVVPNDASPRAPIAPAPAPGRTPLAITLAAPAGGATVPAGQAVALQASVSGNSIQSAAVEFLVDGALVHSAASAPYSFNWMPPRSGSYVAQARVIGADGSRVVSPPVVFTVSPPPLSGAHSDALQHDDIGAPGIAGATSFDASNGSLAVTATGAGLRGTSDQFRFEHAEVAGDAELVARVARFTATHPSAQAGLILRSSGHESAAFAALTVAPKGGVTFSHRAGHGGELDTAGDASGSAPLWLKLTRNGDTLIGFVSWDGTAWNEIGRATAALPFIARGGLITASGNTNSTAAASYENFTITETPQPFIGEDIGGPATSGFTVSDPASGSHVLAGAGSDIGGRRDRFHFAHQSIEGDATIMTRVENLDAPHPGAKAGVMLRAGTETDAQSILLAVTPESGLILQWREASGTITQNRVWPEFSAPVSLALEREGGAVYAYASADGESWQLLQTLAITLPAKCKAGMAITSRTPSATATARFVDTGVVY
ncbi:MAG: glycosyl hydrolase family 28-related protein, partial [Opitutaceae bacterium]